MRKITLLIAFIGMITLQGCSGPQGAQGPQGVAGQDGLLSEVWEYSNVNFLPNTYSVLLTFHHTIYASDMVLLYRLTGNDNGADVWKLLPENYYYNDGTLNFGYNFDFTQSNAYVSMIGNNLSTVSSLNTLNQVIRIVILPGYFGNKSSNNINFNDYYAVASKYNISESKVIKIK
jgi:hypothetical protein